MILITQLVISHEVNHDSCKQAPPSPVDFNFSHEALDATSDTLYAEPLGKKSKIATSMLNVPTTDNSPDVAVSSYCLLIMTDKLLISL